MRPSSPLRSAVGLLLLVATLVVAGGAWAEGIVATKADPATIERVLAEAHVDATPEAVSWHAYAVDLLKSLAAPFLGGLENVFRSFSLSLPALEWFGWILLAAALIASVTALVMHLGGLRRKRTAEGEELLPALAPRPMTEDAGHWRRELDRRLAAGDLPAALVALWWWLARSVGGEGVDPSWTGSELVRNSGRRDLLPAVRRLDALTYGGREVGAADVRSLVDRLEGELA